MSDVSCILSEKQNQETFTDGNNNNQNRKTWSSSLQAGEADAS